MTISPLQKKLLPEVADLPSYETTVALFPLRDTFVSEHLIPHSRFKTQILARVLAEHDVDLTLSAVPFEKEHILQALLNSPIPKIVRGLGLSWNANAVAQSALENEGGSRAYLATFSRQEIQFALRFRDPKDTSVSSDVLSETTVKKDGILCFAAWFADVPDATQRLIEYACVSVGYEVPTLDHLSQEDVDARRAMATRWCERHMAEQSENSDELAEEEATAA